MDKVEEPTWTAALVIEGLTAFYRSLAGVGPHVPPGIMDVRWLDPARQQQAEQDLRCAMSAVSGPTA
jgi:hypothetical protein